MFLLFLYSWKRAHCSCDSLQYDWKTFNKCPKSLHVCFTVFCICVNAVWASKRGREGGEENNFTASIVPQSQPSNMVSFSLCNLPHICSSPIIFLLSCVILHRMFLWSFFLCSSACLLLIASCSEILMREHGRTRSYVLWETGTGEVGVLPVWF